MWLMVCGCFYRHCIGVRIFVSPLEVIPWKIVHFVVSTFEEMSVEVFLRGSHNHAGDITLLAKRWKMFVQWLYFVQQDAGVIIQLVCFGEERTIVCGAFGVAGKWEFFGGESGQTVLAERATPIQGL